VAEIPVFKERRMTGTSALGLEESYFISSSYAGILRLSPNSSSTLLDLNDDITITDEIEDYFYYEDDVTTTLENQFITVSTSDGVLLDMSIKNNGVQFNNLYVLGALSTPDVIIYQNENNKFTIGNIDMPNKHLTGEAYSDNEPSEFVFNNADVAADSYYFLINKAEDGEPTNFEFENARALIKQLTNEALAELTALPTGSIHWIPVNIEEYQKLLKKSDINNSHNSSDLNANTLIRDFLLCDGSCYYSKDFPELAKILNNERIVYWNYESESELLKPIAETNGSRETEVTEDTFRVPDLRSMFIKYVVPDKIDTSDNYFINEGGNLNISNKVGSWEMDSSKNQEIIIDKQLDKHYHFIVLDNNSAQQHNTKSWIQNKSDKEAKANEKAKTAQFDFKNTIDSSLDEWNWPKYLSGAKPLAKYGSTRRHDKYNGTRGGGVRLGNKNLNTTKGCDTRTCTPISCSSDNGPVSYIYYPSTGKYGTSSAYCHGASFTCGYILSIGTSDIYKATNTIDLNNFVGQTSWSLLREIPYSEASLDWTKYNPISNELYAVKETFYGPEENRYQKENCPEFYACLPLIKI
jgi:hypothetical protein